MSECRYFWTNFHKSVESGPVCPSAATFTIFSLTQYGTFDVDAYVFTEAPGPDGLTGMDLVTAASVSVAAKAGYGTVGWVGLDTFTRVNELRLLPATLVESSGGRG